MFARLTSLSGDELFAVTCLFGIRLLGTNVKGEFTHANATMSAATTAPGAHLGGR